VICFCDDGVADSQGLGLLTVTLTAVVRFSVDVTPGEIDDPLGLGRKIGEAIANVMVLDSLPDELNDRGSVKMTVIGSDITQMRQPSARDERTITYEISIPLLCSNQNVR
jgi:hypothetical protein